MTILRFFLETLFGIYTRSTAAIFPTVTVTLNCNRVTLVMSNLVRLFDAEVSLLEAVPQLFLLSSKIQVFSTFSFSII